MLPPDVAGIHFFYFFMKKLLYMVLLKFGSIISLGVGSLGGFTVQHSKGGMQGRTKHMFQKNPTPTQSFIRSINPIIQEQWRKMSDDQRSIWNSYAISHDIRSKKDQSVALSGHSVFMSYQFPYIFNGLPFQLNPFLCVKVPIGPELIVNGSFIGQAPWSLLLAFSYEIGHLHFSAANIGLADEPIILPTNSNFRLKFSLQKVSVAAQFQFSNQSGAFLFAPPYNQLLSLHPDNYTLFVSTTSPSTLFRIFASPSGSSFDISNISLKQLF